MAAMFTDIRIPSRPRDTLIQHSEKIPSRERLAIEFCWNFLTIRW